MQDAADPAEANAKRIADQIGVPNEDEFGDAMQWTDISDSEEEKGWTPAAGKRDDSDKTIAQMMREDDLVYSDLFKMMKQYQRHEKWKYVPSQRAVRFARLAAGTTHTVKAMGLEERGKPVPRTIFTCTWKGKDQFDNVFCCNNTRIRHPRTKDVLRVCGYHVRTCLGMHAGVPPVIEVPNKHGYCLKVYRQKYRADPATFPNVLELPGVVFLRPAKRPHPLRPAPVFAAGGQSESSSEEEEADIPLFAAIKSGLSSFKRAVKHSRISMAQRHRAAATIQALYRAAAARRAVANMRRAANVKARAEAGLKVQALLVRHFRTRRLVAYKASAIAAAKIIQRNFRVARYQLAVKRDGRRASYARRIQRWVRNRNMRINFRILLTRYRARIEVVEKQHARAEIGRVLTGYIARRRFWKVKMQLEVEHEAAKVIQFFMAEYCGQGAEATQDDEVRKPGSPKRSSTVVRRAHINKVANTSTGRQAAILLQRFMRYAVRKQEGMRLRKHMVVCICDIQRVTRGFFARQNMRYRRQVIESAWQWLAPKLPRGYYKNTLVFEQYERQFGARITNLIKPGSQTVKRTNKYDISHLRAGSDTWSADRDKLLDWLQRMQTDFERADKQRSGRVTKQQFWRVLDSNGIRLKAQHREYIAEAFIDPKADKVSYLAYLRFGRSDPRLCTVHRVPVCPECLYIGPCPDSGCPEYRGDPASCIRGDPVMCVCGHHIAAHRPKIRQTQVAETAAAGNSAAGNRDLQSLVSAFAFQDMPEFPRPVTPPDRKAVKGVTVMETVALQEMDGQEVQVDTIEPHVFEVTKGKSLGQLVEQQKALRVFLQFTMAQATAPYHAANAEEEKEEQQHEHVAEQRALRRRASIQAAAAQRARSQRQQTLASLNAGAPMQVELGQSAMQTIAPDGQTLHVTRTLHDSGLVSFESGAAGSGLLGEHYEDAVRQALDVPLASAKREAHFREVSACLAAAESESEQQSAGSSAAEIVKQIQTAHAQELAAMVVPKHSLVPGLAGLGKGARSLPHEGQPTVPVGPGGVRSFRLSRPVFGIQDDRIEQYTDAVLLYLTLLRVFAAPSMDGYDLVADDHRLIKFCFDNHAFLSQHWSKILKDVRTGTLNEHLSLPMESRRALEADMTADPARASLLEQIFDKLGYARRTHKRMLLAQPSRYLGADQGRGDPGAAQRERRLAKRERQRFGPDSMLPSLPDVYLTGASLSASRQQDDEAVMGVEKELAYTLERAHGKHALPQRRQKAAIIANAVKYASEFESSSKLAVQKVDVKDQFGNVYSFGFEPDAKQPYIDLHPGSTQRYVSASAAIAGSKRHASTHLRTTTATDAALGPTWQAADVDEWPGQEVLPPERELPVETETRSMLKQFMKQQQLQEEQLQLAGDRFRSARGFHSRATSGRQHSPASVHGAVERQTPAIARSGQLEYGSPSPNPHLQFATNYGGQHLAPPHAWADTLLSDAGMRDSAQVQELSDTMQGTSGLWLTRQSAPGTVATSTLAAAGAKVLQTHK